ncbi:hypothetical protein [Sporolactobacillus nakayamae]|uniref:Lipoprotein n=1 Tax=Sporolactobacillus nakayamae TaxID=269670 RepID=A0A1I2VME4_9BACL|nr:hypothetical protein [Sporolactobacillus nakayamae]SFG90495.1 hypothetical protein SAMN02982927_03167 [Sporolactobacillus nakayamae]
MKSVLLKLAILASLLIFVVGCSSGDTSRHDNSKSEETIRTVLKSIFTGPDEEQKKLYKIQVTKDPQALTPYLKESISPSSRKGIFRIS